MNNDKLDIAKFHLWNSKFSPLAEGGPGITLGP